MCLNVLEPFTPPSGYEMREQSGCLAYNDLHSLRSTGMNQCVEWCNDNNECAGFTVNRNNRCFFKSDECENDIIFKQYVVLFLKEGN